MGIFQTGLSRRIRNVLSIGVFVALALGAAVGDAKAQTAPTNSTAQAIDTAVDIFASVGSLAGLPIDQTEVPIIKGVVNCVVASTSGASGGDCATNIITTTVLGTISASDPAMAATLQPFSDCLLNGGKPGDCAVKIAVGQLPPEAQALATCVVTGGNIADCTEKAALAQILPQVQGQLPAGAQDTVNCVIGGKSLATCAQNLLNSQVNQALTVAGVPPDLVPGASAMVTCAMGGGNAADCVKSLAIQNLPLEVQGIASCLTKPGAVATSCVANFAAANVTDPTAKAAISCAGQPGAQAQKCMADLAASKITDPTAKAAVSCMGLPSDQAQKCVANLAASTAVGAVQQQAQIQAQAALQTALDTINKLNVTAGMTDPGKFPQQPAVLQNIIKVANGIKDGNWPEIVEGGGAEVAEVASKIILSIFLTPALSNVLSPVVDSMIQNDVNSFTQGMIDLGKGDAVGVGEDIFKWYATQYTQAECALMPDGAFRNTVCNGLADAINFIANAGGNLAKGILGVGEDILKGLGLWNFVDNTATAIWNGLTSVISDIGNFIGIGSKAPNVVCEGWPAPADYYANNVLGACLSSAASDAAGSSPANMSSAAVAAVVNACKSTYELCPIAIKATVEKNCAAMGNAIAQTAQTTAAGLQQAAVAYAQTGVSIFATQMYSKYKKAGNPEDICSDGFWSGTNLAAYDNACAAALGAHFNMPADNNSCPIHPTYPNALVQACQTALNSRPGLTSAAAGPKSALCASWIKNAAVSGGCRFTTATKIVTPAGQVIPTTLDCTSPFRLPPHWGAAVTPVAEPTLRPTWQVIAANPVNLPFRWPRVNGPTTAAFLPVNFHPLQVGAALGPPPPAKGGPLVRPSQANIRPPTAPANSASAPRQRPPVLDNGGHGGINTVNGNTGNAPSNGRTNNTAMDNAASGAMSGGFNNISGNAGGAGIQPRIPTRTSPTATAPPPKSASGGEGGAYKVNGSTGNAPTTGPGLGSKLTTPATAKPPTRPAPADTGPVDFGACPGCGNNGAFKPPK